MYPWWSCLPAELSHFYSQDTWLSFFLKTLVGPILPWESDEKQPQIAMFQSSRKNKYIKDKCLQKLQKLWTMDTVETLYKEI